MPTTIKFSDDTEVTVVPEPGDVQLILREAVTRIGSSPFAELETASGMVWIHAVNVAYFEEATG